MRITKVYTRTGDRGTTGLADGTRVSKADLRLETYGTVDELNAFIGVCRTSSELQQLVADHAHWKRFDVWLECIQNDLFNLGGDLATPVQARWDSMIVVDDAEITRLEQLIDDMQEGLPPLREFVLPGGTRLNAELHVARTVCRRAERLAVQLQEHADINPQAVSFLNRLSDFLFVASRWVLHQREGREVTWMKAGGLRNLAVGVTTPSN
jgi:cob(I)alamin adenosyltransferase